jgi:hypothetical protein
MTGRHYRLIRCLRVSQMPVSSRSAALLLAFATVPLRLLKSDADPLLLAPDDAAGQVVAFRHERELRRDSDRARDIERRAGGRYVANPTIDGAATELDRSALQDPLSARNPVFLFFHRIVLLQEQGDAIPGFKHENTERGDNFRQGVKEILYFFCG